MSPKTKRDFLKRRLAQAYNHLDLAMQDCLEIGLTMQEHHPELHDAMERFAEMLLYIQEGFARFAIVVWGHAPQDWDAWRNPGYRAEERNEEVDDEQATE
jgi:hypothetical protein